MAKRRRKKDRSVARLVKKAERPPTLPYGPAHVTIDAIRRAVERLPKTATQKESDDGTH